MMYISTCCSIKRFLNKTTNLVYVARPRPTLDHQKKLCGLQIIKSKICHVVSKTSCIDYMIDIYYENI